MSPRPVVVSPLIRDDNSHQPMQPITTTLASDFKSSTSPCVPKMRFRPLRGLILSGLKAIAPQRKPKAPSTAGAPTADTIVAINSSPIGSTMCPPCRMITVAGAKSSTASRPKRSEPRSSSARPETSSGPPSAIQPAPTIITSAVAISLDWRTSPFSADSLSRFWVGSSVFSPPSPSAMSAPPAQCDSVRKVEPALDRGQDAVAHHGRGDRHQHHTRQDRGGQPYREEVHRRRRSRQHRHHHLHEDQREADRQRDRHASREHVATEHHDVVDAALPEPRLPRRQRMVAVHYHARQGEMAVHR